MDGKRWRGQWQIHEWMAGKRAWTDNDDGQGCSCSLPRYCPIACGFKPAVRQRRIWSFTITVLYGMLTTCVHMHLQNTIPFSC